MAVMMRAGGVSCAVLPPGPRQVNHAPPGKIAEQPRRQGGGGILNPPGTILEPFKLCRVTVEITADRLVIDQNTVKARRPAGGIARRCDVQRWWHHRKFHGPACPLISPVDAASSVGSSPADCLPDRSP